jgi:hypothetical protein
MTLAQRRRALMAQKPSEEQWDYVWNYTDGMPEYNGFVKTKTGSASSTMTENGVVLTVPEPSIDYVIYSFPITQTISGIVEVEVRFDFLPSSNTSQGFRLCLSNGTTGGQIMCPNKGLCLMTSNTPSSAEKITDVSTGLWYVIRIVLRGPVFDVYLNGSKIVSNRNNLSIYASQTRLMQQAGGQTTIRSIKYKFEQENTP